MEENNLEIQISSTTLGYEGEGGMIGGVKALAQEVISKDKYTETVISNAERFEKVTEQEIPQATFGVSTLASSVNPEQMKELIRSVDYPYLVKWSSKFVKEKIDKVQSEGFKGIGVGVALAQEVAYALLQSHSDSQQVNTTINAAKQIQGDIRIRTCIETISIEDQLNKIKGITSNLEKESKNVTWVIEPNKKVGDGNMADFLNRLENIKKANPNITFGIDLDLGGLPNEDMHILEILDNLDSNKLLPVYISLSGKEYTHADVLSHLPLGNDYENNRKMGEWFKRRMLRGQNIPGIIIETSPTQDKVLKDYQKFLDSFKKGYL